MIKRIFFTLLTLCAFTVATVGAQENEANVAITLERTACFGTCPIYTITIFEDGTVTYNGERFVEVTGEQTSQIDPTTVVQMVEAFEAAGYFDWDEAYDTMTVTDLPTVITSVTRDSKTHQITRYGGDDSAPLLLPFLELWIDEMVNTSQWTGAQTDLSYISYGAESPLVTLQRTACYGPCPIYNVVLFEDGTVVYMGLANVNDIGVRMFETDADSVTSIAERADAIGYFDWQDSYEEFAITDQATVITSIRWEDNFKRIVRYDGDPNAPVGLIWVEEDIDQLVTNVLTSN